MDKGLLGSKTIVQIAIMVHDIEATAKKYAEFLGIDYSTIRFSETDGLDKAQTLYRGKPSEARARLAFINVNEGLDLELIQPDEKPSVWREFLDEKGEGPHHIAFVIKDTKGKIKRLAETGIDLIQSGEFTGGRYAYFDTENWLKIAVETLEFDN